VNLANDTLLARAELPGIAGVKDSSGNIAQSLELLRQRPEGFAVLTGEDASFYTMLAHGADGGILASAHLRSLANCDGRSRSSVSLCITVWEYETRRRT